MSKYRGKLVYMGMGRIGVVSGYSYDENQTDIDETWFIRPVKGSNDDIVETNTKPTILDGVKYGTIGKTLFVEVTIKGQSYPGYAILSPNDEKVNWIGRCLAVARAMGDTESIASLLKTANYDSSDEDADTADTSDEDTNTSDIENAANYVPAEGEITEVSIPESAE